MREIEFACLTKAIEVGDFAALRKAKFTVEYFTDDDAREVFAAIDRHYEKHASAPSMAVLQEIIPFETVEMEDPLSALVERVAEKKLYNDLSIALAEVRDEALSNPRDGLAKLQEASHQIHIQHTGQDDLDAAATADESVERYRRAKEKGGLLGLPYPWEYLNEETRGMRGGEYNVLYADRKSFKSWTALYMAFFLHRYSGVTPLYMTREMKPWMVQDRLVAMYAGVSWSQFRKGTLNSIEEARLEVARTDLKDGPPFPIIPSTRDGVAGVSEFTEKIREYDADFAVFDGLYLLAKGAEWGSMAEVNRAMKQGALRTGIPVTAVTQESSSHDGAGYKSFEQDCDVLMRLVRDDEHRLNKEIRVELPAMRDAVANPFLIHALPAGNFTQKAVLREGGDGASNIRDDNEEESSIVGDDEKPDHVTADGRVKEGEKATKGPIAKKALKKGKKS